MINMQIIYRYLFLFFMLSLVAGCSINKSVPKQTLNEQKKKQPYLYAGVDSALAFQARIKSERLFVNLKKQHCADSLLNYGQDFLKITEELYEDITLKKEKLTKDQEEIEKLEESLKEQKATKLTEQNKLEKMKEQVKEDSLTIAVVNSLLDYFLNHCDVSFQTAHKLNPFNLRTFQLSAQGNWDKGLILEDTLAHRQAVAALVKFLEHDKGYPFIYREIGKNYYQLKNWKQAYHWISDAIKVLKVTAMFEEKKTDTTSKYPWLGAVDPKNYYDYVYDKARAEIKMYMEDSARFSLQQAYLLAPNPTEREKIERIFQWINWDDGNIRAAELRDEINDSLRNKKYEWARQAYIDLIPKLYTVDAKNNVIWRLARVEYHFLKDFETAANRLYQVVAGIDEKKTQIDYPKLMPDDPGEKTRYKERLDSLNTLYVKDCGQMFYDLGIEFQKKGLFNQARAFFVIDTTINWSGRAKSFLYLAQLSRALNMTPEDRKKLTFEQVKEIARRNSMLSIKLLNRMLQFKSDLEKREIEFAYSQLLDLWKEVNPQQVPIVFQEYQQYVASTKAKASN